MRLIAVVLVGGVVLGFLGVFLFQPEIARRVTDLRTQGIALGGVTASLGVVWGWFGKGIFGNRTRE